MNTFVGLIQLIIAILLAAVALSTGYSTFSKITKRIDETKELKYGNVAVGIIIAAILFAIAIVVQSRVAGISIGIMNALDGDWLSLVVSFIQLVPGIISLPSAPFTCPQRHDRFTKGVDEFEELKKGNVAVAIHMAGVIVVTAVIIQSGILGITSALI